MLACLKSNTMPKIRVGLVMKSLNCDFFRIMEEGAERYVSSVSGIELISVGTETQTEVKRQIELVDKLVSDKVDAIVVVPIDSESLSYPVIKAVKSGIPVVNIDIRLDPDILGKYNVIVPYMGPDNKKAAYESGCMLAKRLKKGDNVVVIEGLSCAENAVNRKAGHRMAIEEFGLNITSSVPADWETDKAENVFNKMLEENPDIKGVFCGNDAMALGVSRVLESSGRQDIKICGFDNDPYAKELIEKGIMVSTVDIFSSEMAVEGIKCAVKIINGETVPEEGFSKYSLIY